MGHVTGGQFRAWREGLGITQAKAGIMAGVSRKTIVRAEASEEPIPARIAEIMKRSEIREEARPDAAPAPTLKLNLVNSPGDLKRALVERAARNAKGTVHPKGAYVVAGYNLDNPPQELLDAMMRNPPYATTAAEAKAMRHLRAMQRSTPKEAFPVSRIRLLPLQPVWRVLKSGRRVNAAIPDPQDRDAPAWAGPRGVICADGRVFDYEAAHEMHAPDSFGAPQASVGEW